MKVKLLKSLRKHIRIVYDRDEKVYKLYNSVLGDTRTSAFVKSFEKKEQAFTERRDEILRTLRYRYLRKRRFVTIKDL